MITAKDARRILAAVKGKTILVVGDVMLDKYVCGKVHRISPEAPVPVVQVTEEYYRLGGAANVASNIQALGGQAVMAGAVGRDQNAEDLLGVLRAKGIRTDGIVVCEKMSTTLKTRILAERQQVVRVDHETQPEILLEVTDEIGRRAAGLVDQVDGVLVEDYGKGVITQPLVDAIFPVAAAHGKPIGFDPKDNHELRIPWLTLATPNHKEACSAVAVAEFPLREDGATFEKLDRLGAQVLGKWNCEYLMITLGAHGMYLLSRNHPPQHIPTKAKEVFDVTGAGDTVIATAMLGLLTGATYHEFASLSNHAAGVVVAKLGTATCSPEELVASIGA